MPNVQVIKPTRSPQSTLRDTTKRLKVAAYARVSTDNDEQENSYETQVKYFTELIKSNPNYIFVNMYADEGITGTMLKNRDSFNQMITDAKDGKIDIIFVKSISRFARNTVDLLLTCRELKANNVNVHFQKENLDLLSSSGELMLTIFASLAQEESHSISENVKWTIHKNFEKGIYTMSYKHFLGYEKGEDGKPKIVEEEAKIIRYIYKLFLYGYSVCAITKKLTEEGIPTPMGKKEWHQSTIKSILTNEKYCGDARLQKQFIANFLDHKSVKNEGQLPSYYVSDDHEGIVSHEVFDMVQELMSMPKNGQRNSGDMFSRKLYCPCGCLYGRKVHHSNDKYRTVIYRCNKEYDEGHPERSARLKEATIKETYVQAVNKIICKETIINDILEIARLFEDNSEHESDLAILCDKQNAIAAETERLINDSSKNAEIDSFRKRYDALALEYETLTSKIIKLQNLISERKAKFNKIMHYATCLKSITEPIEQFDDELWFNLLDKAIVGSETITYIFKDGSRVEISL